MNKLQIKEITVSEAKKIKQSLTEIDVMEGVNLNKLDFENMGSTNTKKISELYEQYGKSFVHVPTVRANSVQLLLIKSDNADNQCSNFCYKDEQTESFFYVDTNFNFVKSRRESNSVWPYFFG